MKADACAANRLPVVNSWSSPAIGTPCSVMQPLTVPCDTPMVGTPAAAALRLISPKPASSEASCCPTASAAAQAPTAAATVALLTVGTHESSNCAPCGGVSNRQASLASHPRGPHQGHLMDAVGHVNRVAPAEQPEHVEHARRLVRERPLQHQHRAMLCEPAHEACERDERRRVDVDRVVRRIAADNRQLGAGVHYGVDRERGAALDLGKRFRIAEVKVGQMGNAHRGLPVHPASLDQCGQRLGRLRMFLGLADRACDGLGLQLPVLTAEAPGGVYGVAIDRHVHAVQ